MMVWDDGDESAAQREADRVPTREQAGWRRPDAERFMPRGHAVATDNVSRLPLDRSVCLTCYGAGQNGRGVDCRSCGGTGRTCPNCRGMRFVSYDLPQGHHDFGRAIRCAFCCDGGHVNPEREMRNVREYLARNGHDVLEEAR